MFEEEYRAELFREYTAQTLWNINQIQNLKVEKPNDMPQYLDLLYPVTKEEETADNIIKKVLEKLG